MNQTWLIAGASGGFGQCIASWALKKGNKVILTASNENSKQNIDYLINEYPQMVSTHILDIADLDSISKFADDIIEQNKNIDVLVNCTGYAYRAALEEGETDAVYKQFCVNYFGPIELIKKILPCMRKQRHGVIANISSISAIRAFAGSGYYAASKAALGLMSDALRKEVEPLGIKVIIIEPGNFRTGFHVDGLKGTDIKIDDYSETAGKIRRGVVAGRTDQIGNPDAGARIIVETIEGKNTPKHLILGSDAVKTAIDELQERIDEIKTYESLSISTDYS